MSAQNLLSFDAPTTAPMLVEAVVRAETDLLAELRVEQRLADVLSTEDGLRNFGETFYFVRYDFCRLNFLVGARCGANDRFTTGIVRNLCEEHGLPRGRSHNQLYRDFLDAVGARPESCLHEPDFAARFNARWHRYCTEAPLPQALSALGVYEVLDNPDYALLLRLMKRVDIHKSGIPFFAVHASAHHSELFDDIISEFLDKDADRSYVDKAARFVIDTQRRMWCDLMSHLQAVVSLSVTP